MLRRQRSVKVKFLDIMDLRFIRELSKGRLIFEGMVLKTEAKYGAPGEI